MRPDRIPFLFLIFFSVPLFSQVVPEINYIETDTLENPYMIIDGDTVPRQSISLDEVVLLSRLKFDSKEDQKNYLILRRRTKKVYPYAKLASERLYAMNRRLENLESNRDKKLYTIRVQKYIEGEFTEELKKLSKSEGRILVKLIHRQTGETTFDLVKNLRTGWRAFWYNTTANMFDISLKEEYHPDRVKEDFLIEDILQRSFQDGSLEVQRPAFPIDYFDLADKWTKSKK